MASSDELAHQLLTKLPLLGAEVARAVRASHDSNFNNIAHIHMLHMLIDQPRTFKDLCAQRGIAAPTLSRSLTALERRGWIERVAHPTDRRQVLLQLTSEGRAQHDAISAAALTFLRCKLDLLHTSERAQVARAIAHLSRLFGPSAS
jgi:DNA-binding MarR family transcriptional regulator